MNTAHAATVSVPPLATQSAGRRHIPELDGLRAFAIILVLLTHFWTYPAGSVVFNRVAASGWIGVDLFFVLSGFLITGILWDSRQTPGYFTNFYARRTLRIFPLYYLLLAIVFLILPALGASSEGAWKDDQWLYLAYLANFALAAGGWQLFLLDITWSLSVEEQFYLVWPAVVKYVTRARILTLCLGMVIGLPILRWLCISALGLEWTWMHMMMPLRSDGFALGALVAIALKESLLSQHAIKRMGMVAALAGSPMLVALVVTGNFARDSVLVGTVGYSLVSLISAGVLVVALFPGRLPRAVFTNRSMRHIGKVSYGIYIFHPLCLMVVATALGVVGMEGMSLR